MCVEENILCICDYRELLTAMKERIKIKEMETKRKKNEEGSILIIFLFKIPLFHACRKKHAPPISSETVGSGEENEERAPKR